MNRVARLRARLEAAVAYAIECLDRLDAETEDLEDDETEIISEDEGAAA